MNSNPLNDPGLCPRCRARAVNRAMRRCESCHGALLFDGDDASKVYSHWWMFHRTCFGMAGWFDRSYFTRDPLFIPANVTGATN